jgi:hypothetical protein
VPATSESLADRVARSVERMRALDLYKPPGVAEAISWTSALRALGLSTMDGAAVEHTLGAVLKYDEDLAKAREAGLAALLGDG